MASAVIMPKAGITVESCIIGKWTKKVGDPVAIGDVLFSYETDKATFDCESTAEGVLLEIYYGEGDEVPCLVNVCAVGMPGEDCSMLSPAGATTNTTSSQTTVKPEVPTNARAVIMPKAGITVESCIIGTWQKKVGDFVKLGDVLFTYETDKATFECESTEEGELLEIFFGDGEEVVCLENVCAIGRHGEDCSSLRPGMITQEVSLPSQAPVSVQATPSFQATSGKGAISPRAKKLAVRAGVDPQMAVPTGPNGRIVERDVRALLNRTDTVSNQVAPSADVEYQDVKFSGIRRAISKSMHTSLSTMAQLTHNFSFDASELLAYRKKLKSEGGANAGITIGDMILYAVSRTLLNCPDLNAHMLDANSIRLFNHVNLGVAVDTPRGLMVPTIIHADEMSLLDISNTVKELAGQARTGAISPDKLTGASFTVSNLGGFGVESFTPVINPPQTGIIGVCTTVNRPRYNKNGYLEFYPAMTLSLTYDHRAVDGAPASRYMQSLCKALEHFTDLLEV